VGIASASRNCSPLTVRAAMGCQNDRQTVRRLKMTRLLARVSLFVLALTLSIGAFAASKSETVTIYHNVQLNGKTIPAGEYTVKCDTTGSTAQVKFMMNGKEVATASGQVKTLTNRPEYNQVITQDGNGGAWISEIDFSRGTGVTFDTTTAMSSNGQ
jgi:hypothetical protein